MPGPGNGIFMTNFPAKGWMSYEKLKERREDLIMVVMTGNHDGSSEVDYTVNPATGFPWATGPRDLAGQVTVAQGGDQPGDGEPAHRDVPGRDEVVRRHGAVARPHRLGEAR